MDLKIDYLCEFVQHDNTVCKAWEEFQSLPYHATIYDLVRIADKYKTTPEEMKEHKHCIEYKR